MFFAIMLSVLAGLSTGLGGLVVLLCKKPTSKMMAVSLGFAAGVMITVSLSDMMPHTVHTYAQNMHMINAALAAASLTAMGMVVAMLLEKCIPSEEELLQKKIKSNISVTAMRSALVTTAAIVLHNLPEGVLTLFTGYADPKLGLTLALAIALHNIPEGIAISVPMFYATQKRGKAFLSAFGSGLAEPVGAILAFCVFKNAISPLFLNGLIALVAGIMLYVSVSELIPESLSYQSRGGTIMGIVLGIMIMSIGIYLV